MSVNREPNTSSSPAFELGSNIISFVLSFMLFFTTSYLSHWQKNQVLPICVIFFYTLLSSFYPNTVMFTLFYVVVAKHFSSHWRKNQVLPMCVSISTSWERPHDAVSIGTQLCLHCFMWPSPHDFHLIGGRTRFPQNLTLLVAL